MKKFRLNKGFLLTFLLLNILTSQAFSQSNFSDQEKASLEIKVISGKTGFISCHNSLMQECVIMLSISDQNEGFIIVKNTSTNPAYNIQADLTGIDNVKNTSICTVLNPGEECSVVLKAVAGSTQTFENARVPLKGNNTNIAHFFLTVTL